MITFSVCFESSEILGFFCSIFKRLFFNCSNPERRALLSKLFSLSHDNAETPFLRFLWKNRILLLHLNKKYYTQAEDADDLISIGTIGLIKGINTYQRNKGVRLTTYASRCIENEILMYFRSRRKSAGDVSLSDAIDTDGDLGSLSLLDVVALDEDLDEKICEGELSVQLHRAIRTTLDEREAKIITLRYGLDGQEPRTQRETAQLCHISRSYVSRIEKRALEKLRRALRSD